MPINGLYLALSAPLLGPDIVLADGSGSGLSSDKIQMVRDGFSPVVASINRTALGNKSPYRDELQEIEFNIWGDTADQIYAKQLQIAQWVENAERVYMEFKGEVLGTWQFVSRIKCSPAGSTLTTTSLWYECLVLGRGSSDMTDLFVAPKTSAAGRTLVSEGCRLRVRVRMPWRQMVPSGIAHYTTSTQTTVANGTRTSFAMPTAEAAQSPTFFTATNMPAGFDPATGFGYPGLFLAFAETASIQNGTAVAFNTGGAFYSSIADAANNPVSGANVLRVTPAVANTEYTSLAVPFPSNLGSVGALLALMLLSVRNNSNTATFTLHVEAIAQGVVRRVASLQIPPYTSSNPYAQYVAVGLVPYEDNTSHRIVVASSVGGATLDIDNVVFIGHVSRGVWVLWTPPLLITPAAVGLQVFSSMQHQFTSFSPMVRTTSGMAVPNYRGDADIMTQTAAISVGVFGTGKAGGQSWRLCDPGTGAVISSQSALLRRIRASLVPL